MEEVPVGRQVRVHEIRVVFSNGQQIVFSRDSKKGMAFEATPRGHLILRQFESFVQKLRLLCLDHVVTPIEEPPQEERKLA